MLTEIVQFNTVLQAEQSHCKLQEFGHFMFIGNKSLMAMRRHTGLAL